MARQGITKAQIIQAAEALQAESIPPTVQNVRERIGSGSFTTISAHLAEWRSENTARIAADIPEMPDKVQAAFHQAWGAAVRQTQESLETERQALDARRREMEKEQADMAAEIGRLEKVQEEAEEKTGRIEEELNRERQARAEVDEKLAASAIENARLDERAKGAEARAEELKGQLRELQEKMAEIAKAPAKRKQATAPAIE
uniref:Replication region DNA-binding N-term n=1 Tax=Candidatus Kentrum sp. DK TaxID=2126562 RepID=A0A450TNT5_9GAMM|nr:MAG: replication region DNA-binding N-term [Candidatus Kentron sp. DK]